MNAKTEKVIALKNDGWSLRNIAKEVGISVFTVRSILAKQAQSAPSNLVDTAVDSYPHDSIPKTEVKNLLSGLLVEHSNLQLRLAKRQLVDQFNRLVDEWLDNSDDCTWDYDDLQMYADSVTRIKKDVFDFCEHLGIEAQNLAIFRNASEIKRSFMEDLKEKSDVTFDFDDDVYEMVESLKIEDFDDPHTGIDLMAVFEEDEE